ncbi:hypothetical protein DPMN_044981 [Dreissena polymorpha]|uniref:Uncharacterized protein n=1 Tax=Dreissena polymorpha TaxID=45954 RepID=A0A9D4D3Z1_DREPO|nr:hypothetical protein DPMN_044981 [Dreissena polymorpha]
MQTQPCCLGMKMWTRTLWQTTPGRRQPFAPITCCLTQTLRSITTGAPTLPCLTSRRCFRRRTLAWRMSGRARSCSPCWLETVFWSHFGRRGQAARVVSLERWTALG